MTSLKYKIIKSPVGNLKIVVNEHSLMAILWDNEKPNRVRLAEMAESKNDALILETEKQLTEYFLHRRKHFDLPIHLYGTPFQREVWKSLNAIPYGSICSYKEIALQIGQPNAVRAVGTAIGRNPISIIVPCHRVITSAGTLGGFAGGLDRKRILLDLENK